MRLKSVGFVLLYLGLTLTGCSGARQIMSSSNDEKIVIDGRQSDWKHLSMIDGENIAFGFQNDSDNLYVSLVTNDKIKIMKIIRGGLEIWFEPENSDDKMGIRFPDKPDPEDFQDPYRQKKPSGEAGTDFQKQRDADQEAMLVKSFSMVKQQKQLYVLDEDSRIVKSYPINSEMYSCDISFDKGNLCYELRVPLSVLRAVAGSKINVEFVTGEIESKLQRPDINDRKMAPPGGGGPGGEGESGFQRGQGKRPEGRMGERMDTSPIEYKFEILFSK